MNFTAEQKRIGKLLGIKNVDSQNDLNKINRAIEGASRAGVREIDSQNDIKKIEEYYSQNPGGAAQESNSNASAPGASAPTEQENYYRQMLDNLKIQFSQQASSFQDQLKIQSAQQEAGFQDRLKIMQESFDSAQRTTLGNQARGDQKTAYQLSSTSQGMRSGTAGFRRRPVSKISLTGFAAANNLKNKGGTLNI
jgi:hypothetical protein